MSNSSDNVVYWALNGYGLTVFDIVINMVVLIIACWIIGLNVIVLNALHDKENKEPSDYFLTNLSIADLLTGIYLIYNTVYNMTNFLQLTECLIRFGFGHGVTICSIFQLVALSMDRYVKIIKPFRYSSICNRSIVIVASVMSWTISFVIGFLPLFGWQLPQETNKTCGFMKILTVGYFQLLLVAFLVPLCLLVLIYLRIFKEAYRHAKAIKATPGENMNMMTHSLKFAKTVFIIAGTYSLCWAPMGTVVGLHVSGNLDNYTYIEKGNLIVYATALAFINSLLNPIIYAIKIPVIRKRFKRIFCRKKIENNIGLQEN